jgi:BirA family biotin operon repressor/biotin-[acetyl-CoA-carboxylase] ligase
MSARSPQLAPKADPLDVAALGRAGFATVVHVAELDSTMGPARGLADDAHARLPAVVVADRQRLGQGRRGAGWWQAEGSLAASLVIAAADPQPTWSLACGVALAEAIASLEPRVQPLVRWPNDLEVAGRKLAGILLETCRDRVIVGIGVNTAGAAAHAPPAIGGRVVTLPDLVGRTLDRTRLLAAFLPRFLELIAALAGAPDELARRYRPLCALDGTPVTVYAGDVIHRGMCRGIAPTGALVLDTATGRVLVASGSLTAPADVWPGDRPAT